MPKSCKVIASIGNEKSVKGNVIIYKKDDTVHLYDLDLEKHFYISGVAGYPGDIFVHNHKVYYNDDKGRFVEHNLLTDVLRILHNKIDYLYDAKFNYPYLYTSDIFLNVENGNILAAPELIKKVKCHDNDFAIVLNITKMTPKDNGYHNVEYTATLHDLTDNCKLLYTSPVKKVNSVKGASADGDRANALRAARDDISTKIVSPSIVIIDGEVIKVREKVAEKPRCLVCHKKITSRGLVIPCKHHNFHYECIGDKCPECSGDIADKVSIA